MRPTADSGSNLWETTFRLPWAIVVGGEGGGIRARTRGLCDFCVGIPMRGEVESLNVATASSVLLFEADRQSREQTEIMKVLVIGGGGREHALAWKLAQSKDAEQVFVAPGNTGTAREPGIRNVAIAATDTDALLDFAKSEGIDLTVVGPEDPLAGGLVDRFEAEGCRVLGPRKEAARLGNVPRGSVRISWRVTIFPRHATNASTISIRLGVTWPGRRPRLWSRPMAWRPARVS